jgi:hypothetical protein
MTQSASAAAWRPPAKAKRRFPWGAAAAAISGLLLSQYLAGFLFLWSVRLVPKEASPITVARYAYYFGDRADVRRKLLLASGGGRRCALRQAWRDCEGRPVR